MKFPFHEPNKMAMPCQEDVIKMDRGRHVNVNSGESSNLLVVAGMALWRSDGLFMRHWMALTKCKGKNQKREQQRSGGVWSD